MNDYTQGPHPFRARPRWWVTALMVLSAIGVVCLGVWVNYYATIFAIIAVQCVFGFDVSGHLRSRKYALASVLAIILVVVITKAFEAAQ